MTDALDPRAFAALIAGKPIPTPARRPRATFADLSHQDGEDSLEHFERVAAIFRAETGYLRPGKDCVVHSPERRQAAWDDWIYSVKLRTVAGKR